MNKDIESRLKELRLVSPSSELRSTVLSKARAVWSNGNNGSVLHMQFRHVLALAASLVIFIGVITQLNMMEERQMRMSFNSNLDRSRMSSENIDFLKDIGFAPGYVSAIAGIRNSRQPELKFVLSKHENELKM